MSEKVLHFAPHAALRPDAPLPVKAFIRLDVVDDLYTHMGFVEGAVLIVQVDEVVDGQLHYVEVGEHGFLARVDERPSDRVHVMPHDGETRAKTYNRAELALIGAIVKTYPHELSMPRAPELSFAVGVQRLRWSTDGLGFHADREEMRRWVSMFGGDSEEWKGDKWLQFIHEEDREAYRARWDESLATGKPYLNYGRIFLGGDWYYIIAAANPVRNRAGEIIEWRGFMELEAIEDRRTA